MTVTTMPPAADEAAPAKKGGKKKLIIILVAVLALGGGGYWFFLKPAPKEKPEPVPGDVLSMEPIQINLAGGHYLKIGIALQFVEGGGHGKPDGSAALDSTIELFSGLPMDKLTRAESREELKHKLEKELEHVYHGDVMGVYFVDFVVQ